MAERNQNLSHDDEKANFRSDKRIHEKRERQLNHLRGSNVFFCYCFSYFSPSIKVPDVRYHFSLDIRFGGMVTNTVKIFGENYVKGIVSHCEYVNLCTQKAPHICKFHHSK